MTNVKLAHFTCVKAVSGSGGYCPPTELLKIAYFWHNLCDLTSTMLNMFPGGSFRNQD